jgi:hypothetical protein
MRTKTPEGREPRHVERGFEPRMSKPRDPQSFGTAEQGTGHSPGAGETGDGIGSATKRKFGRPRS